MRLLVLLLTLSACAESHVAGGVPPVDAAFDAGPRPDVPVLRFDGGPSLDVGPRPRDSGPIRVDSGPVFDAGPPPVDARIPFDVLVACDRLCERAIECIPGTERGDCIGGCVEIDAFVTPGVCEEAVMELFRCGEMAACDELEFAFTAGECAERLNEVSVFCDADL